MDAIWWWVIAVVVLIALALLLVPMLRRRNEESKREKAAEVRAEAQEHSQVVRERGGVERRPGHIVSLPH